MSPHASDPVISAEVACQFAAMCRGGAVSFEEMSWAVRAVVQACRICQTVRTTLTVGGVAAKQGREPVTIADFASQAAIVLALSDALSTVRIMAEETADTLRAAGGADLRSAVVQHVLNVRPQAREADILDAIDAGQDPGEHGRFWALDPIDGTKGFLRGDQYAVALALIDDGHVRLGVLGCPGLPFRRQDPTSGGTAFVAVRGAGTYACALNGSAHGQVSASTVDAPERATLCESVEAAHVSHDDAARVSASLGLTQPALRMDSQAKYAAVARGDADLYLRFPSAPGKLERVWDHAAGTVILQEAGGEVTDATGAPLDFTAGRMLARNTGVVASNGRLHPRIISATRSVLHIA